MVGEVTFASRARFATFAAAVESCLEVFPRVPECRGWFVLLACRAYVWPRLRRALVAHPAAFRVLPQLADLERFVTHAASAKEILLL